MRFDKFIEEDRRLTLLKALEAAAQYRANHFLLQRFCESVGHSVSTDRIKADLQWLDEQGLISVGSTGDVMVATLTGRGLDVANARTTVAGVARPMPGSE